MPYDLLRSEIKKGRKEGSGSLISGVEGMRSVLLLTYYNFFIKILLQVNIKYRNDVKVRICS